MIVVRVTLAVVPSIETCGMTLPCTDPSVAAAIPACPVAESVIVHDPAAVPPAEAEGVMLAVVQVCASTTSPLAPAELSPVFPAAVPGIRMPFLFL